MISAARARAGARVTRTGVVHAASGGRALVRFTGVVDQTLGSRVLGLSELARLACPGAGIARTRVIGRTCACARRRVV
jgi:hypothetical protein